LANATLSLLAKSENEPQIIRAFQCEALLGATVPACRQAGVRTKGGKREYFSGKKKADKGRRVSQFMMNES